ncbi:putative zincin peptidase [Salsuginibacillus halophilus]|uniref:Putative zincin peptidase n=1 Tax=Salsuginibacillus halophilus TaxID=517424 RepID=A0A2P8HG06_9BACI|nr:DUF3267 domain-containing protein [Salsuginibacillus halophilus]PSL45158.1 putative zincin peptidase [Salsuginibacillus halophilus]
MNCLQSLQMKQRRHFYRTFFLSILLGTITFIGLYPFFTLLQSVSSFYQLTFWQFTAFTAALFPLHAMIHLGAFWLFKYKVKPKIMKRKRKFYFYYKHADPAPRNIYLMSLLAPFVCLSGPLFIGAAAFPALMPYFLFAAAVNTGISFADLRFALLLLKTPRQAYIESRHNHIDILTKEPSSAS